MYDFASKQDWMQHGNVSSRRWKIKRVKTAQDKRLHRLNKEWRKISDEIRNLGYEHLDIPIRCGYKRLFILTEETKRAFNAEFYQGILDKINTVRYSPNKNFDQKKTSRRREKRKRKLKEQKLLELKSGEFHYRDSFSEQERSLFYCIENYNSRSRVDRTKYIFSEPWRFRLSVRPHWITEIQRKDTLLEQRLDDIKKIIFAYKNEGRLIKMRGGYSYSWKKVNNKEEDRKRYAYYSLKNIPLYVIMEQYNEEKKYEHTA